MNGSGGALRAAAAHMVEAGAPPRGGRGRVLWLVSVEVSCCLDPVRAGVGSGGCLALVDLGRNGREIAGVFEPALGGFGMG